MNFCVCCCLFVYCVYKISTKSTFSFNRDVYKERDVRYTFTFCTVDCFSMSVISALLHKKKLEDSTRIFGMKFNDQTVTYLFLAKWFTCFKTANNNQNLFSKFESLRRDE